MKNPPPQTPIEILEDYAEQYAELELASFSKAQYLEEISLLTKETLTAIYNLLAKEAVEPLYTANEDGTFNVVEAIPLSKIKELLS